MTPSSPPPSRRALGSTGIEVPSLSFGAATLGGLYHGVDTGEAERAVHHAIERGVDLFDCSPYYGLNTAEERLGKALEGRRDRATVMTKCGRYDADAFDFSRERVLTSIDESLQRLRCDHVDVFFAHDVEFSDERQILEETIPALHEVKRSGKARAIGITGLPVTHLRSLAERSDVDVILSYCRANLLDQAAVTVLGDFCRERGIGLINASPLHMGILSGREAPDWHPAAPQIRSLGLELKELCMNFRPGAPREIAAVALEFSLALASEHMQSTLCGMKTIAEVDQNLAAQHAAATKSIDEELLAAVREKIGDYVAWTWLQGRPENSQGPGEARFSPGGKPR